MDSQPVSSQPQHQNQPQNQPQSQLPSPSSEQLKLVDIPVTDENTAFNLIFSFVHLAHKRGVFTLDESAKIWECVKVFQKP